ncbi:hypothetical protein [Streptomyces sp. NPDC007905]
MGVRADHFLAFTGITCTLICYRRLTKAFSMCGSHQTKRSA